MIRLDGLLVKLNIASRSESKKIIKSGKVKVNGIINKSPETKINEYDDIISYNGNEYKYIKYSYFVFNKPDGCVSATKDNSQTTVIDLFSAKYKEKNKDIEGINFKDFFPVGRLDKDTVGLLLITNDGELSHKLLSPKYHVDKTYFVKLRNELNDNDIVRLENGIDIGDHICLPAKISEYNAISLSCKITINEGKFHQVKRMFESVGNKVIYLQRISFGALFLNDISEGDYRTLSMDEVNELRNLVNEN